MARKANRAGIKYCCITQNYSFFLSLHQPDLSFVIKTNFSAYTHPPILFNQPFMSSETLETADQRPLYGAKARKRPSFDDVIDREEASDRKYEKTEAASLAKAFGHTEQAQIQKWRAEISKQARRIAEGNSTLQRILEKNLSLNNSRKPWHFSYAGITFYPIHAKVYSSLSVGEKDGKFYRLYTRYEDFDLLDQLDDDAGEPERRPKITYEMQEIHDIEAFIGPEN